jgi:anti-sigma factor RsiW
MAEPSLPGEVVLGGLRCGEVLALLPDALTGELAPDVAAAVQVHVAGCSRCAALGASYAAAIQALRAHGAAVEPVPADVADRLRARLTAALADG